MFNDKDEYEALRPVDPEDRPFVHVTLDTAPPKALQINLDDTRQMFAGTATVRAAIFDVIDAGCSCFSEEHPWELYKNPNDDEQDEDIGSAQRERFVDDVIARIAELQQPPHHGIKLQDLCPKHIKAALPESTAQWCSQCSVGEKVKADGEFKVMVFHVLFNVEGGPVQEEHIMAVSFEDCEEEIQRRHPDAVHWEIGM